MRRRTTDRSGLLLLDQAVAAGIGGACSTICTNPMEMFRIRLQVRSHLVVPVLFFLGVDALYVVVVSKECAVHMLMIFL